MCGRTIQPGNYFTKTFFHASCLKSGSLIKVHIYSVRLQEHVTFTNICKVVMIDKYRTKWPILQNNNAVMIFFCSHEDLDSVNELTALLLKFRKC